jgi:hypothetical protein
MRYTEAILILRLLLNMLVLCCLCKLERAKGIEPSAQNPQVAENQDTAKDGERAYTQIRAQIQGNVGRDLAQVVNAWPELPAAFKAAILAIVTTATNKEGQ